MKDELRDFVKSHRASFDDQEAPAHAWRKVEQTLFPRTIRIEPIRYWQAAAILFFVCSAYQFLQDGLPLVKRDAAKELADAEAFYTQEISEKIKLIHANTSNESYDFAEDFQQLEAMYAVLKEEMQQHPSEKVKDAMMLNLMVRINLLNKQLQEVDSENEDTQPRVIS